jgi:hypothetical protein
MTIKGISDNVQALLEDTDSFVTVLPGPPEADSDFAGYPSAAHYFTGAENEYATVSQNRRRVNYVVELYIVPDSSTTFTTMMSTEAYPLLDSIIQMFDESQDLSSDTIPLSRACDIMKPAPGRIARIETKEGDGVMITIDLFCEGDSQVVN